MSIKSGDYYTVSVYWVGKIHPYGMATRCDTLEDALHVAELTAKGGFLKPGKCEVHVKHVIDTSEVIRKITYNKAVTEESC